MNKLQPHHLTEAERMRQAGQSWRAIGRAFGVDGETVMRAIDPIYAERVRNRVRASRQRTGRQHHSRATPYSVLHRDTSPLKVNAVRIHHLDDIEIWSRVVAASWDGKQSLISLPYVSIQCTPAGEVR